MDYQLVEIRDEERADRVRKNAGGKARADVTVILAELGAVPCEAVISENARASAKGLKKLLWHRDVITTLKNSFSPLRPGDTLFIQFPLRFHSVLIGPYLKDLVRSGISVILIIHDLETIRWAKLPRKALSKLRYRLEEQLALTACSRLIVHNETMKAFLAKSGIPEQKMVLLELFDYLASVDISTAANRFQKSRGVIIAGNLSLKKSGYLEHLPDDVQWELYGVGYEKDEKENVRYHGSFTPEELPQKLEGSFGLVWDGPSAETCTGVFGDYLRVNNPHKLSLYLASGLPVIIWKEAALASFVEASGVGFPVSSLHEIRSMLDRMSEEEYSEMQRRSAEFSSRLREGFFLREAAAQARKGLKP